MTNVVLIDDERSLRDVIEEGLVELFGCSVRAESDGESGLQALRRRSADVLLVDLLMPGLNGFDVLKRLQSGPESVHRPRRVIAMSALTDLDTVQTLRELDVDAVLPKPFSLQELRSALDIDRLQAVETAITRPESHSRERQGVQAASY